MSECSKLVIIGFIFFGAWLSIITYQVEKHEVAVFALCLDHPEFSACRNF